jgi:hypothetical protein
MADSVSEFHSVFPGHGFPTVFADGVMSMAHSPTMVKFFLHRFDPDFASSGESQVQPIAQVVMPMEGFVATYAFFERSVKAFIERGVVSQERVDEFRNAGVAEDSNARGD